jgi:hypothetical protein
MKSSPVKFVRDAASLLFPENISSPDMIHEGKQREKCIDKQKRQEKYEGGC